jgi:hypothetical protein
MTDITYTYLQVILLSISGILLIGFSTQLYIERVLSHQDAKFRARRERAERAHQERVRDRLKEKRKKQIPTHLIIEEHEADHDRLHVEVEPSPSGSSAVGSIQAFSDDSGSTTTLAPLSMVKQQQQQQQGSIQSATNLSASSSLPVPSSSSHGDHTHSSELELNPVFGSQSSANPAAAAAAGSADSHSDGDIYDSLSDNDNDKDYDEKDDIPDMQRTPSFRKMYLRRKQNRTETIRNVVPPPAVTHLQKVFHRIGVIMSVLAVARNIDPYSLHGIYSSAVSFTIMNSITCFGLFAAMRVFYVPLELVYKMMLTPEPKSTRIGLVSAMIIVLGTTAFIAIFELTDDSKVYNWQLAVLLISLIIVEALVLIVFGVGMFRLDKLIHRRESHQQEFDHVSGSSRSDQINRAIKSLRVLFTFCAGMMIVAILVEMYVTYEKLRDFSAVRDFNPNSFDAEDDASFAGLQVMVMSILLYLSWIPLRYICTPYDIRILERVDNNTVLESVYVEASIADPGLVSLSDDELTEPASRIRMASFATRPHNRSYSVSSSTQQSRSSVVSTVASPSNVPAVLESPTEEV